MAALPANIREPALHYSKKGDLLPPLLKVKYGISGPSDVMWMVDDEIRGELAALARRTERGDWWHTRPDNALKRAEEMIYKEQNILFPISAVNFTEEEWGASTETRRTTASTSARRPRSGRQRSMGPSVTPAQIAALFNMIPLEITFVDVDDINRFFNESPKVFKRPSTPLDRDVFSCPPKIEAMVRAVIDDFRAGKLDRVPIWVEKGGRTMLLVTYMAVRDNDGKYLGTVELV